jgi:hypothetical protein
MLRTMARAESPDVHHQRRMGLYHPMSGMPATADTMDVATGRPFGVSADMHGDFFGHSGCDAVQTGPTSPQYGPDGMVTIPLYMGVHGACGGHLQACAVCGVCTQAVKLGGCCSRRSV